MKVLITIAIALTLVGCATRPGSIPASYVSHEKYVHRNCADLAEWASGAQQILTKYSEAQNNIANGDALTVFLILIPASKLAGDHYADVAQWKGEVAAIEVAQIKNGCTR